MMRVYDIIEKKKLGNALTDEEIAYISKGYLDGTVPDYQMAALMMAICFSSMSERETVALTREITLSGDVIDLSPIGDGTVDKHSTGGVGDKTTLIVAPIVAAVGGKVAKMSGRGLGHTGGTIDKLESFPGFRTDLTVEEFISQVKDIGLAVAGQTGVLAPLDKKLYALRDVTATVDSLPLIASSIMGKKLASGTSSIVLDVKYGSGAFMKELKDAISLAKCMVSIGRANGKQMSALITDMDTPLGYAIGNILEVKEAIELLNGNSATDLYNVCLALASRMVAISKDVSDTEAMTMCEDAVKSGKALSKFREWINAQGGDTTLIDKPERFPVADNIVEVKADRAGYIGRMNAEQIGNLACEVGAGRTTMDAPIDHSAGIIMKKKTGDPVSVGDTIALIHTNRTELIDGCVEAYLEAIDICKDKPEANQLIAKVIK